jgi:ABC-type antimicrobial peptide transport system permease subunit
VIQQFRFYLSHSLNDLRVNGQRTFFALLCIAAGVAAIVSLQTLASMIQSTLTANLQENNRGDLQITVTQGQGDETLAQQRGGVEAGYLVQTEVGFAGFQGNQYALSPEGAEAVRAWLAQNYPTADYTLRRQLASPIAIFTGTGIATLVTHVSSGRELSGLVPVMVEADVYPFYGNITTLDGRALRDVLREEGDIVMGVSAAETLEASVGDELAISGAEGTFRLVGIVPNEAEIRNPSQDILAALNGFYILDMRSGARFVDVPIRYNTSYLRLNGGESVSETEDKLREAFPFLRATTTEELGQTYERIGESVNQLVTVMGLIALLLGSVGIINTMQVIVRRRIKEIAVLKTVGLQASQITQLFLLQAFLMGVMGSVAGIVLGWGLVFVIRGVAESLLGAPLPFQFAPNAIVGGLVVGTLVTTVFGFIPTLSAGRIRPSVVLRQDDSPLPKAGRLQTLLALVVVIFALIVVAFGILADIVTATAVIVGSFVVAGFLLLLLNLLIWLVGRFLPSFGIVDLKVSLREMLATRGRAAVTLLALVVGVFSLSLITMLATFVSQTLSDLFLTGDNVFIQVGGGERVLPTVIETLETLEGETRYAVTRTYNMTLKAIEKAGDEATLDEARIGEILRANDFFYQQALNSNATDTPEATARLQNLRDRRLREMRSLYSPVDGLPSGESRAVTLLSGRNLTPDDAGKPNIVVQTSDFLTELGVQVGDAFVYEYSFGGIFGIGATSGTVRYEVVGISEQPNTVNFAQSGQFVYAEALPANMPATQIRITANVQPDQIAPLRRALSVLPQTFLLEIEAINRLLNVFLGQFTAFPLLVALLGLAVGGVVIANSVALSTMERRREIAIMKSVGLQRERVLGMLLMENGILGIVGGLLGVGMGLLGLVLLLGEDIGTRPLPLAEAFGLMMLCLLVALVAALTTAWGASGEKPLNVLRYE